MNICDVFKGQRVLWSVKRGTGFTRRLATVLFVASTPAAKTQRICLELDQGGVLVYADAKNVQPAVE
jgi:hypothetical protein